MAVALLAPAGSGGYEVFPGGPFWSGNPAVLKYNSKLNRKREPPLKKAIAAWNHSGVDIKLKPSSAGEANIIFKPWRNVACGNGLTGPFVPNGKVEVLLGVEPLVPGNPATVCKFIDVLTAAHEIGHVLGLDHENDRCALMNSTSKTKSDFDGRPAATAPQECKLNGPNQWYCRVLSKDDIRGAESMYGGKVKVRNPAYCPIAGGGPN